MEESTKTKDKLKEFFNKKYTWTILYSIIIILYVISLNIICHTIDVTIITKNASILGIVTLIISIFILEKSYRDNGKNSLSAIEFLVLSIYMILMNHISRIYNYEIQAYITTGAVFVISYYILKMAILYTKEHKEQLNSLSDIKQIIKDEPIKKETKRKNIKK